MKTALLLVLLSTSCAPKRPSTVEAACEAPTARTSAPSACEIAVASSR